MSKSLEALDVLYTHLENANQVVVVRECSLVYQTIKQDLEHKEQLEKRNKELVNIIDELREENFKIKQIQTCIWGEQDTVRQEQIETLIKENQKLKKDYNLLDTTMESDDRIICKLLKEKEQLQNDIILNETQIDDLTLEVANYKHALEEKNEIIMDLKEELESLHQAYNELNQTNEELIKINNQLGKEKEELSNEITLLKNKIEQLKNMKEGK